MSDGIDVLARRYRKLIGDELWRGLLERQVGLVLLWKDRTLDCWHAYGHWPSYAEEDVPWWALDDRATIMAHGDDAKAAVTAMLRDPRIGSKAGLAVSMARLGVEIVSLTRAIRGA